MRFFLLLILSACFSQLVAQDYYWVNNGGNWSDLSHWATTSGGSTYHTELPGPENDVYFDENSFSMVDQVVFLDSELQECHNFDATGVTNQPLIQGDYYLDHLDIYGNFTLPPEMNRDLKVVEFIAESGEYTITCGEVNMGGLCFMRVSGNATYQLQDSLSTANLYLYGGEFHCNGHPINAQTRFRGFSNYTNLIDLDGSNLYTNEFTMYEDPILSLNGTQIFIQNNGNMSWSFKGGGKTYPYVKFDGAFYIEDNNFFGEFEVAPGSTIEFDPAFVQTAENFVLNGTSIEPISISSTTDGEAASISQASGAVNATWLVLQDSNAMGGAEFNATQSVDNGNNSGWNIIENIPQDFYWVGGSGNWSDVNHWATTSGGTSYHSTPPTVLDNVFFDVNSFATSGEEVTIDLEGVQMNNLDASGALSGTLITSQVGLATQMDVYGNIHTGSMIWSVYNLNVVSSNDVVTIESTTGQLDNTQLGITCSGQVQILDSLAVNWIHIFEGDVSINNTEITIFNYFRTAPTWEGTLDADGFTGYIYQWSLLSDLGTYHLQNTNLTIEGIIQMNEQVHGTITLDGDVVVQGGGYVQTLNLLPGNSYELTAGITIELETLNAIGTELEPISIYSNTEGVAATFSKADGLVEAQHLILKDNHATGGATFSVFLSEDLGNTDGWEFVVISVEEHHQEASIFPNPFKSALTIDWPAHSSGKIRLYDLVGNLVYQANFIADRQTFMLPELPNGMYIIELLTENYTLSQQLLKN